jgi:hypothetical protein
MPYIRWTGDRRSQPSLFVIFSFASSLLAFFEVPVGELEHFQIQRVADQFSLNRAQGMAGGHGVKSCRFRF